MIQQQAIVVVSGGRDVHPTREQLPALARTLVTWRTRVLRFGDATGVDQAVWEYIHLTG